MFGMFFETSLEIKAQTYYYRTTEFAIKYKTSYGWGNWSDWQKSNIKMKIDLDDDMIVIYSEKLQVYSVLKSMGTYTDESGGKQTKFYVVDQDEDLGYIRLRIERNGNAQVYIDFEDVMWVYNVVRTN
jgi:hypothetical protein